jgi:uncharacterized protein
MTVEESARQRDQDRWGASADGAALEHLSRQECLDLLASLSIGRLVYTRQALPAVEPVSFGLSNGEIIILGGAGGQLAAATRGDVVAFEADALDAAAGSGWSVTVIGRSRQARGHAEIGRLRRLRLISWTPGEREHFICIGMEIVKGRRLRPHSAAGDEAAGDGQEPAEPSPPTEPIGGGGQRVGEAERAPRPTP